MLKKEKMLSILLGLGMILGLLNLTVTAEDFGLLWNDTFENLDLQQGDNWFSIQLENDDGASLHDIYFEVTTDWNYPGLYTELYYNNKSNILTGNSQNDISNYCLAHKAARPGWYYLKVYAPYETVRASITSDKYVTAIDAYEPNNRINFASQLELTTDTIITADLGDSNYCDDIDFYAYMATEPCMLTVDLYDDNGAELSIYVGDSLIGTTDRWETLPSSASLIKSFPYSFNHTHGLCYFKVYGSYGGYKLRITKKDFQSTPVLYNASPLQKQLYSEFDILTPKINILANGTVNVYYSHSRNGEFYDSIKTQMTANDKTFTGYQFPDLLPTQISNSGTGTQNYLQFYAEHTSGARLMGKAYAALNYDNTPPSCKEVVVEAAAESIEISVSGATDANRLAQKPYRYRIYPSGSSPTEYSEWLTRNYYSMGIETGLELTPGTEYTVDVQIRDRIAETCQNASQDLSNHICTVTKTAQTTETEGV